ncbi:leucine-rich repeat domain-containing protein [Nannocystis punicea]|uniref:Disease resistance R13L4/SHOC-2-like LRR domain-containing protein n=1 Tax=Nannocystis punicea TaxID=2995304 RepID=A0ABY7HIW7_9BACT|nr:hypothetical protein [Nannocystis poenicansa]WAS98814.1 hypothetical protein O0S08_22010 [Nannocystis poenicansa]
MPVIHARSLEEALTSPRDVEALELKLTRATLPDEIFALRNLAQLTIEGGTLTKVSPRLAELKKLRFLSLDKQPKLDLADFPVMPSLESLGLRNCKLRALPPALFECRNLTSLSLGMNPLKTVPAGIGALRKLNTLYLWGCGLKAVSPELGELTELRVLELEKNSISELPAELAALKQLTQLNIEKNAFETFPAVVCELTQLQSLEAYDNEITALPAAISQLKRLAKLRLEGNRIEKFPADLSGLKALETFYVSLGINKDELKRQIRHLPPKAFIMSFDDGDIARDGRWADAPARSSREIAEEAEEAEAPAKPAKKVAKKVAKVTKAAAAKSKAAATAEEQIFRFENRVTRVTFVPGGVVGVSYESIRVFDLASGELRFKAPGDYHGVAASPDGTQLLAGGPVTALLDPKTGAVQAKLPVKTAYCASWSLDGKLILLYDDGDLCCVDAKTLKILQRLEVDRTSFATLSPDGQRVLYGAGKAVRMWDRLAGKEVFRATVCRFGAADGRFTADNRYAIVLTTEGLVRLDLGQKKPKSEPIKKLSASAFDMLPNGTHAVVGGPKISLVELGKGSTVAVLGSHEKVGPVDSIVISADGTQVASGACDHTVRVWQLPRA